MSKILYITSDKIGTSTGGGIVTEHELKALQQLGDVIAFGNDCIGYTNGILDPFRTDLNVADKVRSLLKDYKFKFAHFYSGSYTETIKLLHEHGVKVSYTVAAHNVKTSWEEHAILKQQFPYPHLTDAGMYKLYIHGYQLADVVIAPSSVSAKYLANLGCNNVKIVPHGTHIPRKIAKFPNVFNVGYLGQYGPDKGVIYLLRAWSMLNYYDSNLLLGGSQSVHYLPEVRNECCGNVQIKGFVDDINELYDSCSVIVQPSVSEGFGIEVLEAMAHGRPVIVSEGAGSSDVVFNGDDGFIIPIRNPNAIAEKIDILKNDKNLLNWMSMNARKKALEYDWDIIVRKYHEIWRNFDVAI